MFTLLHKTTTPPFEPAFEPAIEKERHILNPRHPMKPRAGNVTCVQTNLDSSGNFKSETARDGESERRPSEKRTRGLTWSSNVVPPNRRTGRHVMSLRRCVCVNVMMMHHWTSFLDLLRKCSSLEYHDTCQHPLQKLLLDNKFPLQERDHARSVFQTQVMQIVDVREDGPCTDSKKMAQSWRQHPK